MDEPDSLDARVLCIRCGVSIRAYTASRTGGLCAPCKSGRQRADESVFRSVQRVMTSRIEIEWRRMVEVAFGDHGLAALTSDERAYVRLRLFQSEILNGGLKQLLWNSSGDLLGPAIETLEEWGLKDFADALQGAARILVGGASPSPQCDRRRAQLRSADHDSSADSSRQAMTRFEMAWESAHDRLQAVIDRLEASILGPEPA